MHFKGSKQYLDRLLSGFEEGGVNSEQRQWLREVIPYYMGAKDYETACRMGVIYVQSLHRLPYREYSEEVSGPVINEEHIQAYAFAVKLLEDIPRPYWKQLFSVMVEESLRSRITLDGFRQVFQGLQHSKKPRDRAVCKLLRLADKKTL